MTKEQFEYKLASLEHRRDVLNKEYAELIALMLGDEPFDEGKVRQHFNAIRDNIDQVEKEYRELYKVKVLGGIE